MCFLVLVPGQRRYPHNRRRVFFNGRLAFQEVGEIETEGTAVVLLPQQEEVESVPLLEIQDEPAVTIAVTGEPVVQGQQTTLVLPPPNEPGVQGAGTLVVTTLADEDDGGFGGTGLSLREAISMASDGDTIVFDPSLNNGTTTDGVIILSLGELVIDKSLTIIGDLDGGDSTRDITVDADGKSRVFRIDDGDFNIDSEVSIDGLVITGGVTSGSGGGISNLESLNLVSSTISDNSADSDGGGIFSRASTKITNSIISGNSANDDGGGIRDIADGLEITNSTISGNTAFSGGGLSTRTRTNITTSTISDNYARVGGGIDLSNSHRRLLELTNSTISGNSAVNGGGIHNEGVININNSTISGNTASSRGGGVFSNYFEYIYCSPPLNYCDSIPLPGEISFNNSLISGNRANNNGNEIYRQISSVIYADANNLFGDSSQSNTEAFSNFTPGENDINATSDGINIALDNILDPSLADNGGSTLTHALVPGSPAIDAGANPLGLTTDQRGFNREFDGDQNRIATTDIGAFELQFATILRVTLPDGTRANGVDDITFGTPLSEFRDSANDSNLVRPNFADTFQFIDITNTSDEETVTISSIDINALGVSISPQGDFLLNPGETERVNLTYQALIAGEIFDLGNGLVINSNAINSALEIHLSGRSTFNSDINYDGVVELRDIDVFNANLGSEIGDANFDPTADINGDGIINSEDLEILNTELGMLISLPDLIVVDTLEDEDDGDFSLGDRSLREALTRINEGGTIIFAPSLNNGSTTDGVITLSLGELVIDKSLTIIGDLDDDGSTQDITVDADGNSRVFRIDDGSRTESKVSIDGLFITGGIASGSDFRDRGDGGGINNNEFLNLTNSTISGNSADADGGGIYNDGTTEITNATISGNSANFRGGGIYNRGTTEITNSTISGNSAGRNGGGIYNRRRTEITNATISGNSADSRGGGIWNSSSSVTFLSSSIVSGNTSEELGNEVYNGFFFTPYYSSDGQIDDDDNNLFGDNSQSDTEAFFNFTPGDNNINATSDGINIALGNILDPSLADNGGSTLTHALVPGSPAIDAGTNPLELITDQRGLDREFDGDLDGIATADIGAFELQSATILRVTLPDGTVANGIDDITFGTPLSLFRDNAIDSNLVRPNFADTFKFIDITNISNIEAVTISSIDINAPGVSIIPQGDFLLNPGETERVNLTYQPIIAGEVFDLENGLVINSNVLNDSIVEVHLSGRSTFNSDINYDGAVNLGDFGILNANLGSQIGDANFDFSADINRDGRINLGDFGFLNTEFGQSLPSI